MSDAPVLGGALTQQVLVSTVAGDNVSGFANGTGAEARFFYPLGICLDAQGNMLVADCDNHRVRKVTPDGVVSTVAGTGEAGYADGPALTASFRYPRDVAVDAAGAIYVADTDNCCVRKIAPDGQVTTFAGNGQRGFAEGARTAARFVHPNGIVVDPTGTCFVADAGNSRIRKITPGGTVSTFAGDGIPGYADALGTRARFNSLRNLALDAEGNLWVAEYGNSRIRKVSPNGVVSTFAGDGQGGHRDGPAAEARFKDPCGIAVDRHGYLYVADTSSHCLRKISPDGLVTTLAGDPTIPEDFANGPGPQARFNKPWGLAVDAHGTLYLCDGWNHSIRKIVQ